MKVQLGIETVGQRMVLHSIHKIQKQGRSIKVNQTNKNTIRGNLSKRHSQAVGVALHVRAKILIKAIHWVIRNIDKIEVKQL